MARGTDLYGGCKILAAVAAGVIQVLVKSSSILDEVSTSGRGR